MWFTCIWRGGDTGFTWRKKIFDLVGIVAIQVVVVFPIRITRVRRIIYWGAWVVGEWCLCPWGCPCCLVFLLFFGDLMVSYDHSRLIFWDWVRVVFSWFWAWIQWQWMTFWVWGDYFQSRYRWGRDRSWCSLRAWGRYIWYGRDGCTFDVLNLTYISRYREEIWRHRWNRIIWIFCFFLFFYRLPFGGCDCSILCGFRGISFLCTFMFLVRG